jgi:hypothetical protein
MLQRIDHRQVMAIDTFAPEGSPYFFLDDGQADAVQADVERGRFRCPLPGCTDPVFHFARGGHYRDHFVHLNAPGVDHGSPDALATQALVALERWFLLNGCEVTSHGAAHGIGELSIARTGASPIPNTRVLVPWVELSRNHVARIVDDTFSVGFEVMWFLGVPSDAAPQVLHLAGNCVRLPSGPRYLREQGVRVWLFNPVCRFGLGVIADDDGMGSVVSFRAVALWGCGVDERGPVVPEGALAPESDSPAATQTPSTGPNNRRARRRTAQRKRGTEAIDGPIEAALLRRSGVRRICVVAGPTAAEDVIRGELGSAFPIDVVGRMNLWTLPALRSKDTLLLVFAERARLAEVSAALGQLDDRTLLLVRDEEFTYRQLFDAVDLLDQGSANT